MIAELMSVKLGIMIDPITLFALPEIPFMTSLLFRAACIEYGW